MMTNLVSKAAKRAVVGISRGIKGHMRIDVSPKNISKVAKRERDEKGYLQRLQRIGPSPTASTTGSANKEI